MSRIAKTALSLPAGVEINIGTDRVSAKGPKGELGFALHPHIRIIQEAASLRVQLADTVTNPSKHLRSMFGTTRALLNNLITGVSQGFEKQLMITGVGYRAQAQGQQLNLSLGYSHPVEYQLPDGVIAETPTQTSIVLRAADKQILGQAAAEIRAFRPPEPYKGKGIRYADEHIVRKQAKKK